MSVYFNNKFMQYGWIPALTLLAFPGHADDVKQTIDESLQYYEQGEYNDAVDSLNYAIQLIQQKKGKSLEAFLPAPLSGWQAQDSKSQSVGAAMFGGGLTAERKYSKGNARITVQIVTDSPVLQGVMMMFSNPMFASSDGGKLERIGRQKAIVKYDSDKKRGDIQVVVAKRILVTIEGDQVNLDDLKAYAKAIDYKKLAAM